MDDPKIIAALFGLLGLLVGLFLQQKNLSRKEELEKNEKKDEKFFSIYEHFYSDEMIETRRKADEFLLKNIDKNYNYCIGYESGKDAVAFSKVLHFFQRLAVACDTKQIDAELAKSYLKQQLKYWYNEHLNRFENELNSRNEFTQVLKLVKQWGIA